MTAATMRWRVRVGAPRRDVPVEYGSWSAVYEQADLQRASLAAAANRPLTRHRRRSSSLGLSLPGDLVWAAAPAAQPPPPEPIDAGQPPVAAGAPGAGVPARYGAAIQQPTPVRHTRTWESSGSASWSRMPFPAATRADGARPGVLGVRVAEAPDQHV
jgi:hypothetical protein